MQYHLNLAHLYGDLLNTYSDIGNILVLKYYAKQMDTDIDVQIVSLDDDFDPNKFDFALFGGGQDYEQTIVSRDLPNKAAAIKKFINDDKPMLAVCGRLSTAWAILHWCRWQEDSGRRCIATPD